MKIKDTIIILAIVTFMSLFSNVLGTKADIIQSIPGLLLLSACCCPNIFPAVFRLRHGL